jgi:hypothetical protein
MKLVLFIHSDSRQKGTILETVIGKTFQRENLLVLRSFNGLKARIKQFASFNDIEIFILLADSQKRLKELISLIDLLDGKRLILILPDGLETTLSKGSHFSPRFFTVMNEDYDDLCDVLHKMIKHKEKMNAI